MAWWDKNKPEEVKSIRPVVKPKSFMEEAKEYLESKPEFPEPEEQPQEIQEPDRLPSEEEVNIAMMIVQYKALWRRLQLIEAFIKQGKSLGEYREDGKTPKHPYEYVNEAEEIQYNIEQLERIFLENTPSSEHENVKKDIQQFRLQALKGKDGYGYVAVPK